ncbi:MAG: hypothetical protein ABIT82_08710 [Ramlibacter sp.]
MTSPSTPSGQVPPPVHSFASGAIPLSAIMTLGAGDKDEAIRLVRAHSGIGLEEATAAIEAHLVLDRQAHDRAAAAELEDATAVKPGMSPGQVEGPGTRLWWMALPVVAVLAYLAWYFRNYWR